jgi:predicted  nucleic acid-binding Zn-ribbon protein
MARSPRAPQKSLEDALQRVQSQIEEKKREIVGLEREQKQLEEAIEVLSR